MAGKVPEKQAGLATLIMSPRLPFVWAPSSGWLVEDGERVSFGNTCRVQNLWMSSAVRDWDFLSCEIWDVWCIRLVPVPSRFQDRAQTGARGPIQSFPCFLAIGNQDRWVAGTSRADSCRNSE